MHYGSGTVDRTADRQPADAAGTGHTLHVHSPDGSTILREITSRCHLEIQLYQSMCIYLKNNPAEFHSDPIWNQGS